MDQPILPVPALVNTLAAGWKTSEGRMTAVSGGLYALGGVAEAVGWIPPGSTDTLMPVLGLVAAYVLSRTALKAVQARQTPPTALPLIEAAAAPLTPIDPLAGLSQALQALNQARAFQASLAETARDILGIQPRELAPAATPGPSAVQS